jgi:hypothetical protein
MPYKKAKEKGNSRKLALPKLPNFAQKVFMYM